tara:strand:+ start:6547 stop:7062 length:516 start_codon:yes stop_codon:yes gene_type:complete
MAFNIKATNSCKNIVMTIRPLTTATTGEIKLTSITYGGSSIKIPITLNSGTSTKIIQEVSNLPASAGVFMFELTEGQKHVATKALLIHCDIDCCLVKLTNEILACECDCPKCSSALAKAQKVFLLLQAAKFKMDEVNSPPRGSTITGDYEDISDKYKKAREICDGSCGCEC